jgi:multidrug efflux pump subunit AcrA (membrane-fusion protein)
MTARTLALTFLSALAVAGCNAQSEVKHESTARPVLVAEIHYAPRETDRTLPGVVKARIESDLGFRVGGKIARRLVDAGAIVNKGQALAILDDSDLRLQSEQAEADLSAAKSALDQQAAEFKRVETLRRQGWSAVSDFDKAKAAADQARASFTRA